MKLRTLFSLSLATVAFSCFTVEGYSQEAAAPAVNPEAKASEGDAAGKAVNPEKAALKEKIKAARKAAKDDPAVVEARKAAREAQHAHRKAERDALVEKNPELAEKFGKRRGEGKDGKRAERGERPERKRPSPEEMEKFRAEREARRAEREAQLASVAEVPAVKEAAAKRDAAQKAYKDSLKAALSKAEPTLSAEVVEKLSERMSEQRHGKRGRGGWGRGHGPHRGHGGPAGAPEQPAPEAPPTAPEGGDAGGEDDGGDA